MEARAYSRLYLARGIGLSVNGSVREPRGASLERDTHTTTCVGVSADRQCVSASRCGREMHPTQLVSDALLVCVSVCVCSVPDLGIVPLSREVSQGFKDERTKEAVA